MTKHTSDTDPWPGPRLNYVGSRCDDGMFTVTQIDVVAPDDPRERAICRGLLTYALALIDTADLNARINLPDMSAGPDD